MSVINRYTSKADKKAARQRLRKLAHVLDTSFNVPMMKQRVGWDAIIGMIPVVGDVITGVLSSYIIFEGYRLGADRKTMAKMVGNVALDMIVGGIPVIGDFADFFFRAAVRNLKLLGITSDGAEDDKDDEGDDDGAEDSSRGSSRKKVDSRSSRGSGSGNGHARAGKGKGKAASR